VYIISDPFIAELYSLIEGEPFNHALEDPYDEDEDDFDWDEEEDNQ
jgi:hypothetical protein